MTTRSCLSIIKHLSLSSIILIFLFTLAALRDTQAQSNLGIIKIQVEDQYGAVVAGTEILVKDSTGRQQRMVTSENGSFEFPLPPGNYVATISKEGFAPISSKTIQLAVNQLQPLTIVLEIKGLEEIIVDIKDRNLADVMAVTTIFDGRAIRNLPSNRNSFQSLIDLAPGVVPTIVTETEQGQFSVNGQRPDANYFMVDGVSGNFGASGVNSLGQYVSGSLPATTVLGGYNALISLDEIKEVQILGSTYAPEYGRMPGGQVLITTRSGSNQFHGALFNYFRNDKLNANDWFANRDSLPRPPLRHNDFGGTFSGPIILPWLGLRKGKIYSGHDHSFFFFSYEGLRLRQPSFGVTDVPTLEYKKNAPASVAALLNAYPKPNGEYGTAFKSSFSDPTSTDSLGLRIDHAVNSRMSVFGRFSQTPSSATRRGGMLGDGVYGRPSLSSLLSMSAKTRTLTIGATNELHRAVNNDLRLNTSHSEFLTRYDQDNFGGAVPVTDSLIFPFGLTRREASSSISFLLIGPSVDGVSSDSLPLGKIADLTQKQLNIIDNLSITRGHYQLKFGFDYRRLAPTLALPVYEQQLLFVANPDRQPQGTSAYVFTRKPESRLYFHNFSLYGQSSSWIGDRLALTYGARWEIVPAPIEKNRLDIPIDIPRNIPVLNFDWNKPYKTSLGNLAPRFGITYQLHKHGTFEAVVRAGIGVFYDLGNNQAGSVINRDAPRHQGAKSVTYSGWRLLAEDINSLTLSTPVYLYAPVTVIDTALRLPRIYQWSMLIDTRLGQEWMLTTAYIAAVGRKLLRGDSYRNASPYDINFINNSATSDYYALQVNYRGRVATNLYMSGSYVWSKSIDDVSGNAVRYFVAKRGPSDYDIRHALGGTVTVEIPKLQRSRIINLPFSGWALNVMFKARSPLPLDIVRSYSFVRPNLNLGEPIWRNDPLAPGGKVLNNRAFTFINGEGSLGRNAVRAFPFAQFDAAIRRDFKVTDRFNLQFRIEAFNLLNHPNFGNNGSLWETQCNWDGTQCRIGDVPNQMLNRTLGGGGAGGGFNPLYQQGGPRSIQLSFRMQF